MIERSGNLIVISGPSGVGKSTLVKSLLGLLKPLAGSIAYSPDISGGSISVTSAPGEGTEFVVRLKRITA